MRAYQFINESPLDDLENRLPKIKSDQYDVDEKGKIYHNARQASKQAHKAREQLTASDEMFDDGLNIQDEVTESRSMDGKCFKSRRHAQSTFELRHKRSTRRSSYR